MIGLAMPLQPPGTWWWWGPIAMKTRALIQGVYTFLDGMRPRGIRKKNYWPPTVPTVICLGFPWQSLRTH